MPCESIFIRLCPRMYLAGSVAGTYHNEDSVKILYFGLARERAGVSSEEIRFDTTVTVGLLWQRLIELHPGLAECRSISRVAADMEYVGDTDTIADAAEIAIIPPVAGG